MKPSTAGWLFAAPALTVIGLFFGLPVIASDIGGVRDAIVDGQNGFIVPRYDDQTLSLRMRDLAGNPELCRAMSERNRKDVLQYDSSVVHRNLADVYSHVFWKKPR